MLPGSPAVTVPALLAVSFVFGAGGQLVNVAVMAVRQTVTPDGMQGRAAATITFVGMGLSPVVMALSPLAHLGRKLPAPKNAQVTAGRPDGNSGG